jgi:hypothetical protein
MPTVRLERAGLFGPVGVVDTAQARRFSIAGVLQGASLLEPSASDIDPLLTAGPGPVIETRYQLAWLLAGRRHPQGRGLMIGLGGGSGVVGLLHEFPEMHLDVVDVDPRVVEMAREFHPLLRSYEKSGRATVSVADGTDFLAGIETKYDFVIADIVVDSEQIDRLKTSSFIGSLVGASREVWLHVFGSIWDGHLHEVLERFDATDQSVAWLFSPVRPDIQMPAQRNWVLTTAAMEPPDPRGFVPFVGLRGPQVATIREGYAKLVAHAITRAEARQLKP